MTTNPLTSITQLHEADYNPRAITGEALSGLKSSLAEFGDLSGITWNQRTGNLVCGHQRMRSLKSMHGEKLEIQPDEIEGRAWIIAPGMEPFPVRVVDWDEDAEKAANMTANNPEIQGSFTEGATALLAQIKERKPQIFAEARLSQLHAKLNISEKKRDREAPEAGSVLGSYEPLRPSRRFRSLGKTYR